MVMRFTPEYARAAAILSLLLLIVACNPDNSGEPAAPVSEQAAPGGAAAPAGNKTVAPGESEAVEPGREVVSERLPYAEVKDQLVYGHFVFPADMIEPLPAVIMIHEWWGLNDNIRAMADLLAAEGYIVLAVDLFEGEVATSVNAARQLMLRVVEQPESATENIRQAYDFVSSIAGAPRVASLGWDFGGGWSLNTALLFPEDLDAAVIYYGQVTADDERLRPLNVPVLGLFGAADTTIRIESVRAFEAALQRLYKPYYIHVYPGAKHSFANPADADYNPATADDAWRRTLQFLRENLIGAGAAAD